MEEEQEKKSEMQEVPKRAPIVCPVCGSREIAFITEYHKYIGLKIVNYILIGILAVFVYARIYDAMRNIESDAFTTAIIIVLGILVIGFQIGILIGESKTNVQAICRDCGNIWLLN